MKILRIFVFILAAFVALAPFAVAEQHEEKPSPEMEAMMKMASPGENHKLLGKLVGDWTFTNKMWMDPSQPPAESGGTMHAEWMLGGRYVHSVWKGNFMGMPFEGHGTDGYDNMSKMFVSTWVDNMGTGIMYQTGTCDASGTSCSVSGEMLDPMTGQMTTVTSKSKWIDDKNFVLEMFAKNASGKEMKTMELSAARK